jgi:hypothetical protein
MVVLAETGVVFTENVAVFEPLAIVIAEGTLAAGLDEVRDTVKPVEPAFADRLTVPVELLPPTTLVGDNDTAVTFWA